MFHILRRGETLEQLSVRYGIPVCMLVRANPQIRIGAKLVIPSPDFCRSALRYTVRKGDTLFRIAEKHSTTMFALLQKNPSIDPQNLQDGDELLLPPPARIYTCRAADTVRSVAERFGISEDALRKANNLSDGLYHGMQLILPED
ncbi:MAG: LysM peptidoglycan-binding domain-containing protein [Christensenellaceae bacterium]|nr:LysM peptidoglycan-binding domain-containing protein [Christensenellaceae bacterium]